LLGAGADANVFGEIHPANLSGRVDQKFGGAGNIRAVDACVGVDEVPAADDVIFGVGENRESIAGGLAEMLGLLRSVYTNGDDTNLTRVEIGKVLFETPQLGVAERSPVAAVEDEDDAGSLAEGGACGGLEACREGRLKEIRKRDVVAGRVGKGEIRRELADLRRAVGRGNVFRKNQDSIEKEADKKNAENSQDAAEDFSAIGVGSAEGAQDAGD